VAFNDELGFDFAQIIQFGQRIRVRHFDVAFPGGGSYFDDDLTLTQSGTDLFISGILQPMDATEGSNEAILMEQGKMLQADAKLYIAGSIDTSGTFRIGLGSPPGLELAPVDNGIIPWSVEGVNIYKKIYLRVLPTGSLAEE